MDDPPYIPTFQKVERVIEIIKSRGNAMNLFELKDAVNFDLDCPLITNALFDDPRIKVCRKRNLIRFFPNNEVSPESPEWVTQFRTGVPKRCLNVRANVAAHQRMTEGQFVLEKDYIEDEYVWFCHRPRTMPLPLKMADRLIELNDKK